LSHLNAIGEFLGRICMGKGEKTLNRRPHLRMLSVCLIALGTAAITSCGAREQPSAPMFLDHDLLLKGKAGTPYAITKRADGGFIIAGNMGSAWAVRTTSQGAVVWKFDEEDGASEFRGIVTLADGSTLLCGNADHGLIGLVVIVSAEGRVLEERRLLPSEYKDSWSTGSFDHCMPWGDGIALLGTATVAIEGTNRGLGWLVKLDKNGQKQWEKYARDFVASDAVVTDDQALVIVRPDQTGGANVVRLDASGQKIAERAFKGDLNFLHALTPTDAVTVIRYGGKVRLLTLDRQLADAAPERLVGPYYIDHGCGYLLSDGSVALFGQIGNLRPAIIRVGPPETKDTVLEFPASLGSFAVYSAVPLGAGQFVAVRPQNITKVGPNGFAVADEERDGVVMMWVTMPDLKDETGSRTIRN
jgi:hypothetical protein